MKARPIEEYHEDMGDVLWWVFPITEPPYVGSPNDTGNVVIVRTIGGRYGNRDTMVHVGGWPGYHTHFTTIQIPDDPVR